jgi:hypothetical protein
MKKLTFTMLAIVASLGLYAQVPSYVPTNGLVGYWPFNGNANDESGNGNNGTVNGATLTSDRFGNANKAYSFDGVNDKISTIINPLQANWSVSFWFKSLNSNSNFGGQNIIGLGSDLYGYGGAGFQCFGQIPPGQCPNFNYLNQMYMVDASQECGGNYLGGVLYSNSTWYNVVIIKNNSNHDLIVNNELITSNFLLDINIDQIIFGNRDISFQYFNGNIDDIGIWNRALTQQEITTLYQGCTNSIITQPVNQNVLAGNNAQFGVIVSSGTASYQWQQNSGTGYSNLSDFGQYSGVTTNTLTVSNVNSSQNNYGYRCIINDGGCLDTTTIALLTVNNNVGMNEASISTFSIYPNPANENITISLSKPANNVAIEVYDMYGKLLMAEVSKSGKQIDLSIADLSSGTYLLRVIDQGKTHKQLFVKQ